MPLAPDDPLLAVVSPPHLERFRELLGIDEQTQIRASFVGWSKLVLLIDDRAVLFPRHHGHVDPLRFEVEALRVLAPAGLSEIPRVLAVYEEDAGISAYPVACIERLPGVILEDVLEDVSADELAELAAQIGRLAARWHPLPAGPLVERPPRRLPHRATLDELLSGSEAPDVVAARLADALDLEKSDVRRTAGAISRARGLDPVVTHGDIHEGQLLVTREGNGGLRLAGIIDWQTAVQDHPFVEFDLGEWGPTLWRLHRAAFPRLRQRYWDAYAGERSLPQELAPVFEWCWCASQALNVARGRSEFGPEVTGTAEEARELVLDATRALPDPGPEPG